MNERNNNNTTSLNKKEFQGPKNTRVKTSKQRDKNKTIRLLYFSLMEFMQNYYNPNKNLKEKKLFISSNKLNLFPSMQKKTDRKLIIKKFRNKNASNIEKKFEDFRISTDDKKMQKNSSFHFNEFNKKTPNRKRVQSNIERNKFNESEIIGKKKFKEKEKKFIINANKNDNENNIKSIDIQYKFVKKEPKKEMSNEKDNSKFKDDKNVNIIYLKKNVLLKKVKSVADLKNEEKNINRKKINSSYASNKNLLRNDNAKIKVLNNEKTEKNYSGFYQKDTNKVSEYIFDDNNNVNYHQLNIRFGVGTQLIKNFYKIKIDNKYYKVKNIDKDKIRIRNKFDLKGKYINLNKELMNNYRPKIEIISRNRNNMNFISFSSEENNLPNQTSSRIKSSEINKNLLRNRVQENNSVKNKDLSKKLKNHYIFRNNLIKEEAMKKIFKTKYDKLDNKSSFINYKKEIKNNNGDDQKNNLLNENKKEEKKNRFYRIPKSGFYNNKRNNNNNNNKGNNNNNDNYNNDNNNNNNSNNINNNNDNKNNNKTPQEIEKPTILNRYISKVKKKDNSDIIDLI